MLIHIFVWISAARTDGKFASFLQLLAAHSANNRSICRGVGIVPTKKQVPMRTPYDEQKSTASVTENPTDPGMYSNMHSMRAEQSAVSTASMQDAAVRSLAACTSLMIDSHCLSSCHIHIWQLGYPKG